MKVYCVAVSTLVKSGCADMQMFRVLSHTDLEWYITGSRRHVHLHSTMQCTEMTRGVCTAVSLTNSEQMNIYSTRLRR